MRLAHLAISQTDNLPIRHQGNVHSGKVRSVYWLTPEDSQRLIRTQSYGIHPDTPLGVMVISDRISAYEIIWQGEDGLAGIPCKGASLNATAQHWFDEFEKAGFAGNHILATPHPLVWIVQRAQPVMVEAIAREYITGSLWRDYDKGERRICDIDLPEGLRHGDWLPELLITPSTKGIMRSIPGVPEKDDVNITRQQIIDNWAAFGFASPTDVERYEYLLAQGFRLISEQAAWAGQILADTKFEFGYTSEAEDVSTLIYIDEVGTLDSSRYWDMPAYQDGRMVENSKEMFRKFLCDSVPDRDILLNKSRMAERELLGKSFKIPVEAMMDVSELYCDVAEQLTGSPVPEIENARQEILDALSPYGLIE